MSEGIPETPDVASVRYTVKELLTRLEYKLDQALSGKADKTEVDRLTDRLTSIVADVTDLKDRADTEDAVGVYKAKVWKWVASAGAFAGSAALVVSIVRPVHP